MTHHVCKLSFHRNVHRLGLAVCLAALMILVLPDISAPAAASPPQNPNSGREQVTANMEKALQSITGSENSEGTHEPGVDGQTSQTASSGKKNRALAQANFEQAKHDAMQLSGLAQALQLSSANPTATFCRSMSSTRRPRSKSWRKKLREPPRGSSTLG